MPLGFDYVQWKWMGINENEMVLVSQLSLWVNFVVKIKPVPDQEY